MYGYSISAILSIGLLVLFSLKLVYNRIVQYRKLSHVPGPFLSGVSRWFFIKNAAKNTLHLDCGEVCKTYGLACSKSSYMRHHHAYFE